MRNFTRAALLILFASVLGLGPVLQAAPGDVYAAVAYSARTNRYGYGVNYPTKAAALARARRECGPGATFTNWCKNSWIALAVSDRARGGCGSGWGTTPDAARHAARHQCLARNPDARVVVCVSAYGN